VSLRNTKGKASRIQAENSSRDILKKIIGNKAVVL